MCGHLHGLSCNELLLCLELSFHVEIERLDVYEANLLFLPQTSSSGSLQGDAAFL